MKDHNYPGQDNASKTGQNNEHHLLVHSGHPADQTDIRHHNLSWVMVSLSLSSSDMLPQPYTIWRGWKGENASALRLRVRSHVFLHDFMAMADQDLFVLKNDLLLGA